MATQMLPRRPRRDTQPLITPQQWLVWVQVPGRTQLSSVHAWPSSQSWGLPAQLSTLQWSPVVQGSPSSQAPACGTCVQPILA